MHARTRSCLVILTLAFAATLPACAGDGDGAAAPADSPLTAKQLKALRAGEVPPGAVVLKTPQGRRAYLLAAPCCDQFNPLVDDEGRTLCAPTGGLTGRGDGKCPAWVAEALARQRGGRPDPGPAASAAF